MFKKHKYLVFVVFLGFTSLAQANIIRVAIPENQKNVQLFAGALYKFDCEVWNEEGNLVQTALDWRLRDSDGFETTRPGTIDHDGYLEISKGFAGSFRVVVTEITSGLSDEAVVQIQSPFPSEISNIQIFPSFLSLYRGGSTYLSIRCVNGFGQEVRNFTLHYYLRDAWGRIVPFNYVKINNPGYLQVLTWAVPGRYTLHFEDVNGSAHTFIYLDIL